MALGIRVVRGPEWNLLDKDSDGGEGVVGTVVGVGHESSTLVQWDSGIRRYHRASDLRVVDSAPAGNDNRFMISCLSLVQLSKVICDFQFMYSARTTGV